MNLEIKPTFFTTQEDFRKWLLKNHETATELIVGFYKVDSGKPSMSWSQSVDQAICFGWIDGVRKTIDKESYLIRFTPRKPTSIWSAVNIKKVEELTKQGLMQPNGILAFEKRKEHKSKIYTYEKEAVKLSTGFEKKFKANKKAWAFFQSLPPSYHRSAIDWVMSAKQEATSIKRLNELINDSEAGRKIKRLSY
jgi:uncharacterized protein YdeI (YjbR/CyaY-like superfamily)